ncbi:MAG: hypothetical protein ACP6IQ_07455 [Candidatus Njordarchaeia archaeon]
MSDDWLEKIGLIFFTIYCFILLPMGLLTFSLLVISVLIFAMSEQSIRNKIYGRSYCVSLILFTIYYPLLLAVILENFSFYEFAIQVYLPLGLAISTFYIAHFTFRRKGFSLAPLIFRISYLHPIIIATIFMQQGLVKYYIPGMLVPLLITLTIPLINREYRSKRLFEVFKRNPNIWIRNLATSPTIRDDKKKDLYIFYFKTFLENFEYGNFNMAFLFLYFIPDLLGEKTLLDTTLKDLKLDLADSKILSLKVRDLRNIVVHPMIRKLTGEPSKYPKEFLKLKELIPKITLRFLELIVNRIRQQAAY